MHKLRCNYITLTDPEFTYFSLQLLDWDFLRLEGLRKSKRKQGFHINRQLQWLPLLSTTKLHLVKISVISGKKCVYKALSQKPTLNILINRLGNCPFKQVHFFFLIPLNHFCSKDWISPSLFNVPESSPKNKTTI